jgi:uncharacterized membrane protein YtjA (UPF0391 family)
MLHYAVVFFVIALIAAVFGFGGLAAGAAGIAKILFFVFVIMAVATFLFGLIKRTASRVDSPFPTPCKELPMNTNALRLPMPIRPPSAPRAWCARVPIPRLG